MAVDVPPSTEKPVRSLPAFPASLTPAASNALVAPAPERDSSGVDPEKTYQTAMQWLRRGRQYEAITTSLENLVRHYPSEPRYLEALGAAYVSQALDESSSSLPDAVPTHSSREPEASPTALFRRGIEDVEQAIRLQSNIPDFYHTLGWAHLANLRIGIDRDPEKSRRRALEAFTEAVRQNPNEPTYWQALGDLYRFYPQLESQPQPSEKANPAAGKPSIKKPPSLEKAGDETLKPVVTSKAKEVSTADVPNPASPGLDAYRRVSVARPRDAGLHFVLYGIDLKRGEKEAALNELKQAQALNPRNSLPLYLLAFHAFEGGKGASASTSSSDAQGLEWLRAAHAASTFLPDFYSPAYPSLLAPALRRALGDTLPSQTLELYDRLKSLSQKAVVLGDVRQAAGDPEGAEELYGISLVIGQRLVEAAMAAKDRYLLHLPELSAGVATQDLALASLRDMYEKYALTDRLDWMRQQQLSLDGVRQTLAQATDAAGTAAGIDR